MSLLSHIDDAALFGVSVLVAVSLYGVSLLYTPSLPVAPEPVRRVTMADWTPLPSPDRVVPALPDELLGDQPDAPEPVDLEPEGEVAPDVAPVAPEAQAPPKGEPQAPSQAPEIQAPGPETVASGSTDQEAKNDGPRMRPEGKGPSGAGSGRPKKGKKAKCPESHPDVRLADSGTYEVTRTSIDYYTASIERFNQLGWSEAYREDGTKGWKIGGFSCKGILWHAGLRSGDIIQTINGKKTNNALQVIWLYTTMRAKKDFEVVVLRKGERKTLKFHVV